MGCNWIVILTRSSHITLAHNFAQTVPQLLYLPRTRRRKMMTADLNGIGFALGSTYSLGVLPNSLNTGFITFVAG